MNLQIGVKVLLQNGAGQFLLIKRTTLLANETAVSWDIPGGRIEADEPLITALRREVSEELGVELTGNPTLVNAQDIFVPEKDLHVIRLTYLLDAEINPETIRLSNEHQDVAWMTRKQAIELTEPFLSETLTKMPA